MATSWAWAAGAWYYFASNGLMQTGWLDLYGSWYYLWPSGAMATGWVATNKGWYYFVSPSGTMAYKQWVDGGNYYCGHDGLMLTNVYTPGGWWVGADGRYVPGDWLTPAEKSMLYWAQSYSSPSDWLIIIDNSACITGVYWGAQGDWCLYKSWWCTPGKPSTATPHGVFSVGNKGYSFGEDKGYSCYYWTQFYGECLFHSVLYNAHTFVLQDGRLGSALSHGCVRLALENAKWIYDTIPRGTTVVSY